MTIIQKKDVVLFSNFESKSLIICCRNSGNKTVDLKPNKLR